MASFQPIEDAGPRLAFGVIRFLRIFVTAASPSVVGENHQEYRRCYGLFQPVQANSGAEWNDGFQEPLLKKRFQEI